MKKQIVKDFKKAEKKIATLKAKNKTPLYFELAPMLKDLKGWDIETTRNSVIFEHLKKGMILIRKNKDKLEIATPLFCGLNETPIRANLKSIFKAKVLKELLK